MGRLIKSLPFSLHPTVSTAPVPHLLVCSCYITFHIKTYKKGFMAQTGLQGKERKDGSLHTIPPIIPTLPNIIATTDSQRIESIFDLTIINSKRVTAE